MMRMQEGLVLANGRLQRDDAASSAQLMLLSLRTDGGQYSARLHLGEGVVVGLVCVVGGA